MCIFMCVFMCVLMYVFLFICGLRNLEALIQVSRSRSRQRPQQVGFYVTISRFLNGFMAVNAICVLLSGSDEH